MARIRFLITVTLCLLLPMASIGRAADEVDTDTSGSVVFRDSDNAGDTPCLTVNRTHPDFERQLLNARSKGCVKITGSWSIETNLVTSQPGISHFDQDPWMDWNDPDVKRGRVVFKRIEIPIVTTEDWKVKLSIRSQKVIASVSYHF